MTKTNDADKNAGREAVARALMAAEAPAAHSDSAVHAAADPKQLFCQNWPTVRTVLEFLKQYLPRLVQPVVAIIISAGNALYGTICR